MNIYDSGAQFTETTINSLENQYVYKYPAMYFRDAGKPWYSLGKHRIWQARKFSHRTLTKPVVYLAFPWYFVKKVPGTMTKPLRL